jgi:hypothetical protein
MRFVYERWPVSVAPNEYASVAEAIRRHLARIHGLVSIYGFGGVSAPGISDLDRIAVVGGSDPVPSIWPALSRRQRYVALHTPFLVDAETFKLHRWFSYLSNLELLDGEPVAVEEPEESELLGLLLGVEGLVSTRIRLEKLRFAQRIKVRSLLCDLHNLRHDLRLAGLTATSSPAAWKVVDEVSHLRSEWWDIDQYQRELRVSALISAAVTGIDEALGQYENADPGSRSESFSLGGNWRNVRLATVRSPAQGIGAVVPAAVSRRSRRGSELRWNSAHHQVQVPGAVIALLDRLRLGIGTPLNKRRQIVTRYAKFVDSHPGWSRIGLADPFTFT